MDILCCIAWFGIHLLEEYGPKLPWTIALNLMDLMKFRWNQTWEIMILIQLINQSDRIVDDLERTDVNHKEGRGTEAYYKALAATLNLGAEYTLPAYDRLKFGFLSSSRFQGRHSWTEARVSANVSPLTWFEASVNYALSNFGSTGGLMLNFHREVSTSLWLQMFDCVNIQSRVLVCRLIVSLPILI